MPDATTPRQFSVPAVALAEQLAWAARMLEAVGKGRSLTDALAQTPGRLRPGVQALACDALRCLGLTTALVAKLCQRTPADRVRALLCVSVGLLLEECSAERPPERPLERPRYAAHTVVDQAVKALAQMQQPKALAGFVNACLRRFLRERDLLVQQAQTQVEARWNHPAWWVERVRNDHPKHWQRLLQADLRAAPMVLRVNRLRIGRPAYLELLQERGMAALPWGEDGVRLRLPVPVEQLPLWHEGAVSVQDGAAQLAAPLLLDGAPAPQRVLDACAAPGGKTAHLLERGAINVLALDKDASRCKRVRENLARLRLQASVRAADAADPAAWWDGVPFDAILLDAPCTASGIVRRHPDVPWLRRESDVDQLAQQQRRLLDALWPLLKPGGRLLYCTCSVFKAEGADQIAAFLARHGDATPLVAPGHLLPDADDPQEGAGAAASISDNRWRGTDGFFYALLRKQI